MTDYVSDVAHHYGADPELTARIISQMKSKGYFDQLRKEILADIDTKPAYQNMRQRVENAVNRYLKGQKWNAELVKNKLRDSLRRHLTEGRLIHVGPVLNQVLTPDVCSQIAPEVDKQICRELGISEDEEEPEEDSTPNHRRKDGDFDGQGGSSNGPRGFEPPYSGGRHNGRAWRQDNDFFYPYGGGYNRFSRRGGQLDSDGSSEEDEEKKINNEKHPTSNMSQFDEMDFEYSKQEVVELERRENPKEAAKWALEQLAAQKIKIEQELRRIEMEEQRQVAEAEEQTRRREYEEKAKIECDERQKIEIEVEMQRRDVEQQKPKEEIVDETVEELEEPKTPEMSDGEDSDVPEMQIVEDSRQGSTDSADAAKLCEVKVEEVPSAPVAAEIPEEAPALEPEQVPIEETLADAEVGKTPVVEEIGKNVERGVEEVKRRTDERSRSRDERHKSDHRKEHSSSSSSSKRHHSSSSSSKSSSHKSSSRHDSKHGSFRSKEDTKSTSHRSSSSSRRDSDKRKSSSSSRQRKEDKYRSSKSSSSYRRGEDSNNLYYFTPEQSIEAVKGRIHLDEVMIRLEADNSGYESFLSESEDDDPSELWNFELEIDNADAIKVEELLDIEISGVDRDHTSANSSLEEINANEIIKPPSIGKLHLKRHILNGTWDHNEQDASYLSGEIPGNNMLTVVLDKCSDLDSSAVESKVSIQQPIAPPKRKRIVRKMEQRYSTDDLYKPRTTFTSSRRSRE